jgi:aspartyl-tRNA synthetase
VIKVINGLFYHIFNGLNERCQPELNAIRQQFPYIQPLQFSESPVLLEFSEGVRMLAEAGFTQGPHEDLSTENEYELGRLVKEKF